MVFEVSIKFGIGVALGKMPSGKADHLKIIILCNTFTPKIKGIQMVAYLMSPWFEGSIFDVTLVQGQHHDIALALQRLC